MKVLLAHTFNRIEKVVSHIKSCVTEPWNVALDVEQRLSLAYEAWRTVIGSHKTEGYGKARASPSRRM